jgi:hypothetical protein
MKIILLGTLLIVISAIQSSANPIAIDGQRRPITMIAEKVDVSVGKDQSIVSGVYTFRQEKDDWPDEKDTHVLIYVPVILPSKGDAAYDKRYKAPVVTLNGESIERHIRNDISLEDDPTGRPDGLPKGWYLYGYEYEIPLKTLKRIFSINIKYSQLHFPGDVAGYVPIQPPKQHDLAKITFHADRGHVLKPYAARFFFQPSYPTIDVFPEHYKLIRVKSIKTGEQGAAANP